MSSTNGNDMTNCVICYEEADVFGVYDCNHRVCVRCSTKMVFLYRDLKCSQCNELSKKLHFETHLTKNKIVKIHPSVENKNVTYQNNVCKEAVSELLNIKCKECVKLFPDNKHEIFKSQKELLKHFNQHKNSFLCKTCLDRNFEFWDEITIYRKYEEFKEHKKKTHIYCKFCDNLHFDIKAIRAHCMKSHQLCTICATMGQNHLYFEDFNKLTEHYKAEHYCCTDKICINNYCYAFAHKSELWAHYLKVHAIQKEYNEIRIANLAKVNRMDLSEDITNTRQRTNKTETAKLLKNLNIDHYQSDARIVNPVIDFNAEFPTFEGISVMPKRVDESFINKKCRSALSLTVKKPNVALENDVFNVVNSFQNDPHAVYEDGKNALSVLVTDLEELLSNYCFNMDKSIQKQTIYNILNIIKGSNREIELFLEKYLKQMKFPKFEKVEKKEEPKEIKKNNFKIVDLSKMLRK